MGGRGQNKHHMRCHNLHLPNLLPHQHHYHDHHQQQQQQKEMKGVPKGCMVVMVGHEGEEQLERFVIPIVYINHPLFLRLLKEAEEEYGFHHDGPIIIPCHVDEFRHVQGLIDRDYHTHHHHHHHHHQDQDDHDHHHHLHHFLCFKP